jgi:hypothetical protein
MTTKDSDKKYHAYTLEELLQNSCFIASVMRPTEESETFWNKALEDGTVNKQVYETARYFIRSVQMPSEPVLHSEIDCLWEDIEIANKQNLRKSRTRFRFYLSAVAGIAALFILVLMLNHWLNVPPAESYSSHIEDIKAPDTPVTDIQLVLADDETVSLEGKEAEIAYKEEGIAVNNREMDFKNKPTHPDHPVVFNQLIVPLGKRSMLTFAEGSRMWVNAGTRVVYPAVFDKRQREIYVDGEVYLEVSPDADCPFVVKTKTLNVEVLGTSFNITAYESDTIQNIVLVSGAVKVHSDSKKDDAVLAPNEMYSYSNGSGQIKTVDVGNHIAWKSGVYQYKSESLEVILKRLSRYYGQEIVCSPQIAHLKCSGKLDLKDDLQLVLNGISQTAPVICWNDGEKYIITNH